MSYDYSENILVQEKLQGDPADPVFSGGSAAPQPVDHSGPDG